MGASPLALARAVSYLSEQITSLSPGLRLPGVRNLAALCQVAPGTMNKAVRLLQQRGSITVVPGGGIFCGTLSPATARTLSTEITPHSPPPVRVPRWRQVCDEITRSINENRYVAGRMLPMHKELCKLHGVSHSMLGRVLRSLETSGRIQRQGRGYRVWQPTTAAGFSVLDLHMEQQSISALVRATPRSREFWRVLEAECSRLGVRLRVNPDVAPDASREASASSIGHILLPLGMDEAAISPTLVRLAATAQPVAILDEQGIDPAILRTAADPLRRTWALGHDPLPGNEVGRFLLGLGHRRVAFMNLASQSPWCHNRLTGVISAFVNAGLPAASVSNHSPRGYPDFTAFNRELMEWEPIRRLSTTEETRVESVSLFHNWEAGQLYTRDGELRLWGRWLKTVLDPVFESALGDASITAWIAANDIVGLLAMTFLRDRGIKVPQDISIVSFDNTSEAFIAGLTSYDFNIPALVLAMLEHLLPPNPRAVRKPCGRTLGIPGTVMRRGSVSARQG